MSSQNNKPFFQTTTLSGAMRTSVVLVVFLSVARMVCGECPKPTLGSNMMIEGSQPTFPVPDETTVTLTCEVGFKKIGPDEIKCASGQWSRINMRCEVISCGSTKEVLFGHVDYSEGTDFGAFAHVVCDEGYMALGQDKHIYCGLQGKWEGRLQVCEVTKCYPPELTGNVKFSQVKNVYEYLEVITYSCDGGLKLNGSSRASCQTDGSFKPAPPECVEVKCPVPEVINAVIAAGTFQGPHMHESSVTFRCHRGHKLKGIDTSSCDINSQWNPELPECHPVECKVPKILNGEIVDGPRLTYKFRDPVTLKCNEGYRLDGYYILTCLEDGEWSQALPECILIQCPTPEVKFGVLVGDRLPSYKYSDNVTFACIEDYKLVGASTLTCNVNGQWSPKLPQCTLAVSCKAPEVIGGHVVKGSRPSYKHLDSVVFECKSGYTMSGQSTLTCARNSQWSPEPPQCTSDTTPPSPPSNVGKIVGGCLGGVGICALLGTALYFLFGRGKNSDRKDYPGSPQEAVALS